MGLFNFSKPKNQSPKIRDFVWLNHDLKLIGCQKLLKQYPDAIVGGWFQETVDLFDKYLISKEIDTKIILVENITPKIIDNKIIVLLEHNPSLIEEEDLISEWKAQEIIVLSSIDEPLFTHHTFDRINKILPRMNIGNEYIEHSMISKAIKRAQKEYLQENE